TRLVSDWSSDVCSSDLASASARACTWICGAIAGGCKTGDRRNVFQFLGSSVGFGMSNETKGVANEGAVRKPENVPAVPGFPPPRPAHPGGGVRGYANRRARWRRL